MKIQRVEELMDVISEEEWIMVDVLRNIIKNNLPDYCKEKISFNVPYFYGKRGICIIWPASIPRGGIKEGVLLGFWQGHKLQDSARYLTKGTNKKVYYRIYKNVDEIEIGPIVDLIAEAVEVDGLK